MYAADEVYDTAELIPDPDAWVWVEPCTFPVEAEYECEHVTIVRCGLPAVDDEDEPRCQEHLGAWWP